MVESAVDVKSFVLRQKVIVPPHNGRSRSEEEAITSFLTTDPNELKGLMEIYWAAGEDERIVEALPGGDVYATPGIQIETISFTGPDGKDARKHLEDKQKKALGLG